MKYFQCKRSCCPKLTPTSEDYSSFVLEDDYGTKIDTSVEYLETKHYGPIIVNPAKTRPDEIVCIKDIMTDKVAKLTWEQLEYIYIVAKALKLNISLDPEEEDGRPN